jgi:hypothetical protein
LDPLLRKTIPFEKSMKLILTCFVLVAILVRYMPSCAQGCSDAGFCTVGNLRQQSPDSTTRMQKLTVLLPIGTGDEDVFVFTPGIQYDNRLNERWSIQARLTANWASGDLGKASGPGDIFISGTHHLAGSAKWQTSITLGAKLPLSSGNLETGGNPLPMQYQSSLGTADLITGITVTDHTWQFSAGWQQPLSGSNRNQFLPQFWNDPEAADYPPSNDFDRSADVLVRASYLLGAGRKLTFSGGLLAIYHLSEDTYVDPGITNDPISITGSKGLTLNATLTGNWNIAANFAIGFSAGAPLVFRDVRPDGLTRSIVFAPEVNWRF